MIALEQKETAFGVESDFLFYCTFSICRFSITLHNSQDERLLLMR